MSSHTRSMIGESLTHAAKGNQQDALAIWAHEGLKNGVETGLRALARWRVGRLAISRMAGPAPAPQARLRTAIGPMELAGPVGLAPGWDKTGHTIRAWQEAGARHHTTGGITLRPQPGKPRPRLYTFDQSIGDHGKNISLNSYGFPSPGAHQVARTIAEQQARGADIPLIAQVVPNAEMYRPSNRSLIPDELAQSITI